MDERARARGTLRRGLLRFWLVLNIPVIAYFGYTAYVNATCAMSATAAIATWEGELRDVRVRVNEYREGVRQGVPEWQLPYFIGGPDAELTYARTNIGNARRSATDCEARQWTALQLLWSIPLLSLVGVFAFLWAKAGFTP